MTDMVDHRIDRLLAGELAPAEQRQVAQAGLDDPDLFDELVAAALTRSALEVHRTPRHSPSEKPAPASESVRRWPRFAIGGAVAAAAAVAFAIAYTQWTDRAVPAPSVAPIGHAPMALPAPVLLSARAQLVPDQTFRSDEHASRLPKRSGTVVAAHDGLVDLDLGSLDGLRQGEDVRVFRGSHGTVDAGRIRITAAFRERARGRPVGGMPRPGDRVEAGAALHVKALLDQAAARHSLGDAAGARALFALAVSDSEATDVPSNLRRQALEQLGMFRHEAGDLDDATRSLNQAANEFDAAPVAASAERADVLNELGAIQIEQGSYAAAEATLRAAESHATGASKMRVANNLGALAALRGDRAAAESSYRLAYSLAKETPDLARDRADIEKNLNTLRTSR
ncbi:MAG: hypothetical protein ACRD2I_16785 [Vicinamibacterales bacterium]